MASYEVTMRDRTVERVDDADAYQQEGQMTTFFRTDAHRTTVDSWSTRLASFRTAEIIIIRRHEELQAVGTAPVATLERRSA